MLYDLSSSPRGVRAHVPPCAANVGAGALEVFLGACQVMQLEVPPAGRILPEMIREPLLAPRLLLGTGQTTARGADQGSFPTLSLELVEALVHAGVRLIGVDMPEVDVAADAQRPVLQRLQMHGVACLTGVMLEDVPADVYELIALPLHGGAPGSPVRAALRDIEMPTGQNGGCLCAVFAGARG